PALIPALAVDLPQAISLEAQVVIHAVFGPVDPFLDRHLLAPAIVISLQFVTDALSAGRLPACVQDFEGAVIQADQAAAAAVSGCCLERAIEKQPAYGSNHQASHDVHSLSRCISVATSPVSCASPTTVSSRYTRRSSRPP